MTLISQKYWEEVSECQECQILKKERKYPFLCKAHLERQRDM
jgi:hypothetical protein